MKFDSKVVEIGEEALMFITDENNPFVVLFGVNAPTALREMSIIHDGYIFENDPEIGDTFIFGENEYVITAIGEEAMTTFKELGHCTLKFKDSSKPDLPGCIHLKGPVPSVDSIKIGMKISIK